MSFSLARTSSPAGGPAPGTRQQLDELDALLQRMLDLPVRPGDEPAPVAAALEASAREPEEAPSEPAPRAYPPSYMVVETTTPALIDTPLPPIGGESRRIDGAGESRQKDGEGPLSLEDPVPGEGPVPGGRHDLVADQPEDDEAPPEGAGEEWVPFRSSWQPSAQTWAPLARTWEQALGRGAPVGPLHELPFPSAPPAGPHVVMGPGAEEAPAPRPTPTPARVPAPARVPPTPASFRPLVWFNAAFDVGLVPLGPLGRWLRGPAGRNALGAIGVGCLLAAAALVAAEGIGWTW